MPKLIGVNEAPVETTPRRGRKPVHCWMRRGCHLQMRGRRYETTSGETRRGERDGPHYLILILMQHVVLRFGVSLTSRESRIVACASEPHHHIMELRTSEM